MIFTDNILKLFSNEFKITSTREDFERAEVVYQLKSINIPDAVILEGQLKKVYGSDKCIIYVNIDEATDVITHSLKGDFEQFKSELQVGIGGIDEDSSIIIKVVIEKAIVDKRLFLYSLDNIKIYLNDFDVAGAVLFFADLIKTHETIVLVSNDIKSSFNSASIAFQPESANCEQIGFLGDATRQKRLRNIQSTTHAIALSDKQIIPEDFQFNTEPRGIIKNVLCKIEFALLIVAIFDNSSIKESELTFRLNGYKSIDGTVNLEAFPFENYVEEYRKIYNWIHESGNLTDKLGLARNIVSLHLNSQHDLSFSGNMFSSILSAYKVYEKQNIKQYIEIRNKMSDQLLDYNKRANAIVEGFASTFQKSALSVLTLFSSMVAVKILSTSAISPKFTMYSTWFAILILVISFVYMMISRNDTIGQKKRYKKSYKNFKLRYSDLLNADDIDRILIGDKEFKADKAFINKKISIYTILWVVVLVALSAFVASYYLSQK
ncbi:hypothetical protein [Mucilaginibacter rubeus]|uniref:hypothetical protein n=1 Tax=Mucilaginibacter rubeus TaxID=2027860 RepID=UPI0016648411|nr:hypothetical protein [Mucilaginibacter rubeus]GGB22865.1 hypothetical protein GCM10011500_43790 [Mucilaginibacter rubeus]